MSNVERLPDSYDKRTWVKYTGAQLANFPNVEEVTAWGVKWSCKNGVVTAKGTASNISSSITAGIHYFLPIVPDTYFVSGTSGAIKVYVRIIKSDGSTKYIQSQSFTLDGTEQSCCIYAQVNKGVTVNGAVLPMLNKGTKALPWELYTGGQVVYDGSNNYRLLNINEQAIADVKTDAQAIFDALDIMKATGRTLELYGEMIGQKRGALNDVQYRIMIFTRMGINVTQGNYETVISNAKRIFECEANDIVLRDGANACEVVVEKFPLEVLINAGFTSTQAVEMLETLLPIGVTINNANFEGTFEFADTADVYDELAGFGNVDQTIGGYLGLLLGDDENSPVLPL